MAPHTKTAVEKLRELVNQSEVVLPFTGAGISTECGIPDFRSPGGLWTKNAPIHLSDFLMSAEMRDEAWRRRFAMEEQFSTAQPGRGHRAIASLYHAGKVPAVVTQNIDNLHQAAGSKRVIEFHGNSSKLLCMSCGRLYDRKEIVLESLPPRCSCSGVLKPNVVFFGEAIPWKANREAQEEAGSCGVMLVVGTSAVVSPACDLPLIAKRAGATIVEVNLEETQLTRHITHWILKGSASILLKALVNEITSAGRG